MRRSLLLALAFSASLSPAFAQSSGMSAASSGLRGHAEHQDRWLSKGLNGLFGNLARVSDAARPVADMRMR